MSSRKIKWGNIFIALLILAAAFYAFISSDFGKGLLNKKDNNKDMTENGEKATEPSSKYNGAVSDDEFIMGLDSWIGGTPALMALSREYNRDYSLGLKLEYIHNDIDRIKALNEGRIHATEISLPSFIKQLANFPECGVIVGITDFSRGADGILAKAEVKDLNDMEDRKVSFVADGTGKFILNKFLRLTGLRYQDIIPVEREEMEEVIKDLRTGSSDLAVSWSPDMNLALKEINQSKSGSVKMLITTREVPNLIPTVLVVNKKTAEKNPEIVKAFIQTWYASTKYIIERPDKAHQKLMELMNEKADEYGQVALEDVSDSLINIKLMALNDTYKYFDTYGTGRAFDVIINDTVETWKKYGDVKGDINTGKIIYDKALSLIYEDNDEELVVNYDGIEDNGKVSGSENDKVFEKQDEKSIEEKTEKVAKIDIPPVYYNSGKAEVKSDSLPVLDQVVDIAGQFPEYYIIIDAHTDTVGNEDANLKLSRERADAVKNYLITKGVNTDRIVPRGWGEGRLVVKDEKTEEDRAANRRTEFILTRNIAN